MELTLDILGLQGTEALGHRLGQLLFPGAVVALVGPLGAGKTHFVRAIAEGVGVSNPAIVSSPTFVLIHEYPARIPIYHFDAYRLSGAREFEELGTGDYFSRMGISLVEWADRVESALPREQLRVQIRIVDTVRRQFTITAIGQQYEQLLQHLMQETSNIELIR
jgi:tRNA threonylcarbamoyladenosine biosynthesis protein TsaE